MDIRDGLLGYAQLRAEPITAGSQRALAVLERAREMERAKLVQSSQTTLILERGARKLPFLPVLLSDALRPRGGTGGAKLSKNLSAEDAFFLGVMHVYLAKHHNDPLARFIKLLGPEEFDYAHPRDTAVDMLRRAVQLQPRQYWSCFMLGRILAFSDNNKANFHEAVQTFNSCVALRPDYSRGYEQRGLTLVQLSLETSDDQSRNELRERARQDFEMARRLAPDDPSTYWVRGQALQLLKDNSAALATYIQALELEHDLRLKVSRRNQLRGPESLVDEVLRENPNEPAALRLRALINRARQP
jgi:tetratricopeptide (TPR) repeat protein